MRTRFKEIPSSIVAPRGFLASAVFSDIKRLGTGKGSHKGKKRDLGLIVSEVPAVAAGMFTTNQVCAAPVKVCLEHLQGGVAQAIVVNSGNANACTGRGGLKDAFLMAQLVAEQLQMPPEHVLVGSTGRIGVPLPMLHVKAGIEQAAALLGNAPEHAAEVAEAIMTSDTRPKQIAVQFRLSGKTVRIGGICKGAGMIQPGMSATGRRPAARPRSLHATMLCFITTDAAIERKALAFALEEAVALSFNRITVDGDMSTNDTVLVLANGLAENPRITFGRKSGTQSRVSSRSAALGLAGAKVPSNVLDQITAEYLDDQLKGLPPPPAPTAARAPKDAGTRKSTGPGSEGGDAVVFQAALNQVCLELAKMIVRDGEGVSRFVTVRVNGAKSFAEADAAARAVANSALVKTSWNGGDPNWGRIIDALGYSAATVVEEKVDIGYSAPGARSILWSLKQGQPTGVGFKELCAAVSMPEFDLHINLNLGPGRALIYAADLSEAYVDFNKGDISDPDALGG